MFIMSFDFAVDVVIILWPPASSKEDHGKYADDGPKHKKRNRGQKRHEWWNDYCTRRGCIFLNQLCASLCYLHHHCFWIDYATSLLWFVFQSFLLFYYSYVLQVRRGQEKMRIQWLELRLQAKGMCRSQLKRLGLRAQAATTGGQKLLL